MSDPGDETPEPDCECVLPRDSCGSDPRVLVDRQCRLLRPKRPDWPDRLGEMGREVTGYADLDEQLRRIQGKMLRNWCRKRDIEPPAFVQPSDKHANWRSTLEKAREFNALPDTHAEWRSLNESEDAG